MQTTRNRAPRPTKPNPAINLNGVVGIRQGFLGCSTSVEGLTRLPGLATDTLLSRRVLALAGKVNEALRGAAQLAISHPTPATLGDAFNATDAVVAACRSVRRQLGKSGSARMKARTELFLLGVQAGIVGLESGLESIPLLPASAPDYPEDEE